MPLQICYHCMQVYETPDMNLEFLCPTCNTKLIPYNNNLNSAITNDPLSESKITSSEAPHNPFTKPAPLPSFTPSTLKIDNHSAQNQSTTQVNSQSISQPVASVSKKSSNAIPPTTSDADLPSKSMIIRQMQSLVKHSISNEELIADIDSKAPYGKDPTGKSYLIPQKAGEIAQREDMTPWSDRGRLTKSGWGRKLWPSMLIPLITLIPNAVLTIYLAYKQRDHYFMMYVLKQEVFTAGGYCLLCILLLKLIEFCDDNFVALLKPYGKNHEKIKNLFANDIEYLRFEYDFFRKNSDIKMLLPGIIAFFGWMGRYFFILFTFEEFPYPIEEGMDPWMTPHWQMASTVLLTNIGYAFIALFITMFFTLSIRGLFLLGNLGDKPERLSVTSYWKMISDIEAVLTQAQEKQILISQVKQQVVIGGRTYYEFQRANRYIGELLFNFSAILITYCVIAAIILFGISYTGYIITQENVAFLRILLSIVAILSFMLFLLPQFKIHSFLKQFKYQLIDVFSSLRSRLEFFYFESIPNPAIMRRIDPTWETRQDIYHDITTIKDIIDEIYKYGTWSYDFPEIMKVIFMALITLFPLIPFDILVTFL